MLQGTACHMEQYGSQTTYNMETVLQQNIRNADFFRNDCAKLNSWSAIVDEIYNQVRTLPAVLLQLSTCLPLCNATNLPALQQLYPGDL